MGYSTEACLYGLNMMMKLMTVGSCGLNNCFGSMYYERLYSTNFSLDQLQRKLRLPTLLQSAFSLYSLCFGHGLNQRSWKMHGARSSLILISSLAVNGSHSCYASSSCLCRYNFYLEPVTLLVVIISYGVWAYIILGNSTWHEISRLNFGSRIDAYCAIMR